MVFLKITQPDNKQIEELKKYYSSDAHLFMLIYMNGCGPCNETKPEWAKLENVLKKYKQDKSVVIAAIDKDVLEKVDLPNFKNPNSFPTIIYSHNTKTENYEDSNKLESNEKNRTIDSFVKWIEGTLKPLQKGGTHTRRTYKSKSKSKGKSKKGGKWTRKYKKSINCKYGRNK